MRRTPFLVLLAVLVLWAGKLLAGPWPQFHGPNCSGVANGNDKLPAEVGPDKNLRWKTALPPGHSSPVVFGERVYLTGVRDKTLVTIALDRKSGKVLWERKAPHRKLEEVHSSIGSHAQSTPAADGRGVVSFFGSCGLFAYDPDGKLLWHRPFGPFKNDFGSGSSPVLAGDRLLFNQDHDTDSFLMALDRNTGKTIWKVDRAEFPRSYATPVVWEVGGKKQVVVAGTLRVIGYDLATGKELWTVRGLSRIVNTTPVVGADGVLYLSAWAPGADPGDRLEVPPFDEALKKLDANGNGTLELSEVPSGPIRSRFTQIDLDKDGHINRTEYEYMRRIFAAADNVAVAIRPGGTGDITTTHVLWKYRKALPYVPSPVYYRGHVFLVRNGGIVTCLDAKTGRPAKQGRVPGSSSYFSSPVAGDGKVYLVSERGDLSVISARGDWELLSSAKLDEDAYATSAIAYGNLFVRTTKYLYCFGN